MTSGPLPPLNDWPVQVHDPAYGYAWYARPAAFVSQAHVRIGDAAAVNVVQGWIDAVLEERQDDILDAGGILVLHDWRLVERYTSEARVAYLARMRARDPSYLRHSVVCVPPNPLFKMAVQAGNLVAALTARAKVELAEDPRTPLAVHGVEKPARGASFYLRPR